MSSFFGSSFAALIAVGVGAAVGVGTGATCGTAVGAAGTGVFATGGRTGLDLLPEESSSSPFSQALCFLFRIACECATSSNR